MFGIGESWVDVVSWICRLITAVILGGIIGFEREHSHRPAGFRTHILVSVGSALIMMTAIYISKHIEGEIDLSRMSAQVVSGVGFLGAGTILREGFSVKGLTTAASLWAVSCVGIAVGTGFYSGAIAATIIIYITLNSLKKVVVKGKAGKVIYVEVKHLAQKVPE
ncbi:MAG: MgtC/SapB family protein, partial [Ruminococcus sp.]|nr:MgtC/SapB family protein [Ruminococcus sp.]